MEDKKEERLVIAVVAMHAIVSNGQGWDIASTAKLSFELADAMIAKSEMEDKEDGGKS